MTDSPSMQTDMTCRVAAPIDAPNISALITLAYRVEDFFVKGDRTTADDVRTRMLGGEFLMLEDGNGVLAGCVYVEVRGERGYFGMLSIDPARQRQGLGARLVAAAEEHCRRAGCREMEIEVVSLRTDLFPFYRRHEYIERGTRPFPDVDRATLPCHFIVMTRLL